MSSSSLVRDETVFPHGLIVPFKRLKGVSQKWMVKCWDTSDIWRFFMGLMMANDGFLVMNNEMEVSINAGTPSSLDGL